MKELYETILDILIVVAIIFISVAIYFGLRTETILQAITSDVSNEFISEVKKNGTMSVNDYEDFIEQISLSEIMFNIDFEHTYDQHEPEYRYRTIEEIIAAQNAAYKGTNNYTYKEVTTAVPAVYDPPNHGSLNTETNESVLAGAVNTPASSSHSHGTDCYEGHRHDAGDRTFTHYHKHDSDCKEFIMFFASWGTCPNDATIFQRYFNSSMWDSLTNSVKFISAAYLNCPNCGGASVTNSYSLSSYGYSCGYVRDSNGDGFYEQTDSANTYSYILSAPQIEGLSRYNSVLGKYKTYPLSKIYTSGCYSYHVHGEMPELVTEDPPRYWTSPNTIIYDLKHYGWQRFCEIPSRFEVYYKDSRTTIGVAFRPAIENGQLIFKCTGVVGISIYGWYPDITLDQLYGIMTNSSEWVNFISSIEYVTKSEAQWFADIGSRAFNCTGSFSTCSLPAGVWYQGCNKTQEDLPDCGQRIVTISPTHPVQTVYVGEQLITTVKGSFLDGSSKILLGSTTFSTASIGKNQNVTLNYSYLFRGETVSKTCSMNISVILRNKTCTNGHLFNMNSDGSDPGCPYCYTWLRSLSVANPTTPILTITIGTTLQSNGITLLATYLDGHTELLSSGYLDNLDTKYLGMQTVKIGYKGVITTIIVRTICAKITCDICEFVYELYPDGTNPGCPRCISKTPVFTGKVLEYHKSVYTKEILEALYRDGSYGMNNRDIFTIKINNRSSDLARNILRRMFPGLSDRWFLYKKSEVIGDK